MSKPSIKKLWASIAEGVYLSAILKIIVFHPEMLEMALNSLQLNIILLFGIKVTGGVLKGLVGAKYGETANDLPDQS